MDVKENGVGLTTIANYYRGFLVISIDSHLPIIRPTYVCSDFPFHAPRLCSVCPHSLNVLLAG
jgi:hypothetical protein